ncbi:MAG: PspA/IM30 family protein [Phycisphaerales bacterium]|nr:PspA/IM30 family protein [Phycisphaerales bacterium]
MFRRIANLIRGFLGLFVSGLEKANPEALLEVEQENLRKQIGQYNQGLAAHAGLAERLMSQVKKLEVDERDLRAKTAANLKVGNREAAGQMALRLQTVQRELTENRAQLEQAEKTYKELLSARDVSINAARQKIESLKRDLSDLKVKKAMAELTEMASGMVTQIGGSGDTLDRLHNMVQEEKEKASGRLRVAKDNMNLGDVHLKEAEQKALADQALADFAAAEGIALEGAPAATPAAKTMGPGGQTESQSQ